MTVPARPLTAVPDPKPVAGCDGCKAKEKEKKELRGEVRRLTAENERLLRAVHRESHHIDKRAGHDGSRYFKRKQEE